MVFQCPTAMPKPPVRARPARRSLATLLAASVALVAACGASGPRFEQGVYRDGDVCFRVPEPPPAWRRVDVSHGALSFRDDANDASVLVNARCASADENTPLVALTNHLVMGTTERELLVQETEPFDGREALHSVLHAKLDGVPLGFDLFVAKKDGCVYDFAYVARRERFEAGRAAFAAFVRGFRTVPPGSAS